MLKKMPREIRRIA
jgi:hypothetical protein